MQSRVSIPVLGASQVHIRFSGLPRSVEFRPEDWRHERLDTAHDGWWAIDLNALNLPDGSYEYEFVVERDGRSFTAPDPYAEDITRFSGYRGVFHIRNRERVRLPFSWDGELPASGALPNNNELVIYELPMRWVDPGDDGYTRQVGLGTVDKALFERLDQSMVLLGVNCIELLPIQDSPDSLNWGYGTRFFFAPDYDMSEIFDLKLFIKRCHQRRMRVILDIVMNHARKCPLRDLAFDWFFLRSGDEEKDPDGKPRPDWGGDIFRYREQRGGQFQARNFHFGMAEFWIREFHIDGFRLDEFKGIDNYEFIQDFTDHCERVATSAERPYFIVIAEDSWRRTAITTTAGYRGRRVVHSMWDFNFRDELRRLVSNTIYTKLGEPSRSTRVRGFLGLGAFPDMANRVTYCTSHDIGAEEEQRLFPYFMNKIGGANWPDRNAAGFAFEMIVSAMALTLTAPGIAMFLAGEEFADQHDIDRSDWRQKMSDPVDWLRETYPGHREVLGRVRELVRLRTRHAALERNEMEFFGFQNGFHPDFDDNESERLFAFCRTGGQLLGSGGQVVVIANCADRNYPEIWIDWPWGFRPSLQEHGGLRQEYPFIDGAAARLPIGPYQVRVFSV
jgi:1,4-alpha-glucan branching enzyme